MINIFLVFLYFLGKTVEETSTSFRKKTITSSTSESYEFGDSLGEDLRNIAYYLRQHKFNEYDRRYIVDHNEAQNSKLYYAGFPKPPLRSLHWEVHKYCEPSFFECVAYLTKRVMNTALRRNDDTAVVIEEQKWFGLDFTRQIDQTDFECKKLWTTAEDRADPFQGPLERFQWRVTASYFMCLFTMKGTPELRHLNESSCDNHANCLNPYFGAHNQDIRANDSIPFNCAKYSFCPDPCCPIQHMKSYDECFGAIENPCSSVNEPGQQQCSFNISQNTEISDIILNRWNVSCNCPWSGYRWSSFYGLCVDIDECEENSDPCTSLSEACLNLPGSYKCVCKWGYSWNEDSKKCEYSSISDILLLRKESELEAKEKNITESFFGRLSNRIKTKFVRNLSPVRYYCPTLTFLLCIYSSSFINLSRDQLYS